MTMTRTTGWRGRLASYLAEVWGQPFVWGKLDCALFAAGAVQAMTGEDLAAAVRGAYTTAAGARRAVLRLGFEDHVAFAAGFFEEIPVAMASEGDLAVVPGDEDRALGIVQGHLIYVMTPQGMGFVPLLSAERAFRV